MIPVAMFPQICCASYLVPTAAARNTYNIALDVLYSTIALASFANASGIWVLLPASRCCVELPLSSHCLQVSASSVY